MNNLNGFYRVSDENSIGNEATKIPMRGTIGSAGYDFVSTETFTINPGESHTMWSNVKCKMDMRQELQLRPRSSMGTKGIVLLADTIDPDYYNNLKNEGNIGIQLYLRPGFAPVSIKEGDKIVQGIVSRFEVLEGEIAPTKIRAGGFGHTGK